MLDGTGVTGAAYVQREHRDVRVAVVDESDHLDGRFPGSVRGGVVRFRFRVRVTIRVRVRVRVSRC